MKSTLTICIQTFNRSEYLAPLLERLSNVVGVLVLVGDYSSDISHADNNKLLCDKYEFVEYYRGKDGGLDHGFNELVAKASTDYCWLASDDDIIRHECLPSILSILEDKQPALLLTNFEVFNRRLSKRINSRKLNINSDILEVNLQNVSDVAYLLSYVGCCIFNRKLWVENVEQKYIGSYFNHVYVAARLLEHGYLLLAASGIAIEIRANNALWTAHSFRMWTEWWPNAVNFLKGLEPVSSKRLSFNNLLYYYCTGALSPDNHQELFQRNKFLKLFLIPNRNLFVMFVYLMISIKWLSLVSEPGYYILTANPNKVSKWLLKYFYDD